MRSQVEWRGCPGSGGIGRVGGVLLDCVVLGESVSGVVAFGVTGVADVAGGNEVEVVGKSEVVGGSSVGCALVI